MTEAPYVTVDNERKQQNKIEESSENVTDFDSFTLAIGTIVICGADKSFAMRRILWAAILVPLLIIAAAAATIASLSLGGNVKIVNTGLTANTTSLNWGTLCLGSSCTPQNRTSTLSFSLTNIGQVSLTLTYVPSCTVGTLTLGQGNTSLNGVPLAAGSTISAVNATLFVSGTPASNTYTCGVTINGS